MDYPVEYLLLGASVLVLLAHLAFGYSVLAGFLLGAIVSSTDAAAVFSVIGSSCSRLKGNLKSLLEFESASNDPVAVILTISLVHLITNPGASYLDMALLLFLQMSLGILFGYGMGKATVSIMNRLRLDFEGLYPVLSLSLVLFTYGVTASLSYPGAPRFSRPATGFSLLPRNTTFPKYGRFSAAGINPARIFDYLEKDL